MGLHQKLQTIKALRKQKVSWIVIFYFGLEYLGLKKWLTCISIVMAKLYVLKNTSCIKRKFLANALPENKTIIVETGVLGDCMLVVDAFRELNDYCKKNDGELFIICSHAMANIFKNYAHIDAAYICFKNRNNLTRTEIKSIKKSCRNIKFKCLLRRDGHPSALKLSSFIIAQKSLYYSYDVSTRSIFEQKVLPQVYTDIKLIKQDVFIPSVWKELLHDVGFTDYKTKLGKISVPQADFDLPKSKYILICPEASNRTRTVDIEKIQAVIHHIRRKYSIEIVISSDCRDKNYKEELSALTNKYKITSYLGNTSLEEFIYLVSKATLLISCDSGQVHLAANSSVPCICLTGYWDLPYFVPYHFDQISNEDILPIILYPKKIPACAYCGPRGSFAESKECSDRIVKGLSVKCNFDIDNEDIFNAIDSVLEKK
mgnify:CR=1 FL=1